ncbi:MAG: hypothetical protein LAP39_21280 [Acidobacteriia bacterium]|nr:hypothetical protein [Terriglobia bacterium]
MKNDILQQIGLSEPELQKYLRKVTKFYKGLTDAEQRVFIASLGTRKEAMLSFHPNLTARKLKDLLIRGGETAIVFLIHGTIGPGPKKTRLMMPKRDTRG